MIDEFEEDINIDIEIETPFNNLSYLCYEGDLEEIQLFCNSVHLNSIDDAEWRCAFMSSCYYNRNINIAQWLYQLIKTQLMIPNLTRSFNIAFSNACSQGHLLVAQWLLIVEPSINVHNHCGYNLASSHNHPDVVQWLKNRFPNHYQ